MKVAHWVMVNRSGMYRVAESVAAAERALGLDSQIVDFETLPEWANDADVHVSHTHFPDIMRERVTKPLKLVWVGHGTPEHVFQSAVEMGLGGKYGHGDGWMLQQHWLRTADARVTFWPRHQAIWQSFCDKGTVVHCVPLGVDRAFWCPGESRGRFTGYPALLTAENCHYIKWPLDLFLAWPWVYPKIKGQSARLHSVYLPQDQHRWFFPLVNGNGASYGSYISKIVFNHDDLRNAFRSVDYYIGLVRYGDFNRMSLEANATGVKTISYAGNPYSDFWVDEGDQRRIAEQLIGILNGQIQPRQKEQVPDISETAKGMKAIYEQIL